MATLPILIFPTHETAARAKKYGGETEVRRPSPARQGERLGPQIRRLEQAFDDRTGDIRAEVEGADPEKVIVLETVGSVSDFMNAVRRIDGMEWLAELDEEFAADDDFYRPDHAREGVGGRLYLVMSNRAALTEMLRLWSAYQANPEQNLIRGFDKWRRIFERLRDLRLWGTQDRLRETGLLENWEFDIANGKERVNFEAELWFRHSADLRERASEQVSQAIRDLGGDVRQTAIFEDIEYQAVLGSIPSDAVAQILGEAPIRLVQLDEVMFFRPAGQSISIAPAEPPIDGDPNEPPEGAFPQGNPRVALLDGLPITNHARLAGRLIVDDPQGWEQDYQAPERVHGTAMASLIVHGDLSAGDEPLRRPLYVRPIMKPDPADFRNPRAESMPTDQLAIDLLHSAVRRICEGDGDEPPAAPDVRVINISIGDPSRPLDGPLSPFARMLDWLSWRYKVLFIVSAGNATGSIDLGVTRAQVTAMQPNEVTRTVVRSIHSQAHLRRILSPAEAVNALTVGSLHADDSGIVTPAWMIDPYPEAGFPSPANRIGLGFKRGVKPDVLFEGGVQLYRLSPINNDGVLSIVETSNGGPGQRVATPGSLGDLGATRFMCGTSNATAIGTRSSEYLLQMLEDLKDDWTPEQLSLLTKVLIVHSSDWTLAAEILKQELELGDDYRDHLARYFGYGVAQLDRVLECTPSRVTVIASGEISDGAGHVFRLPLPPSLSGRVGVRRLVISLAWFTPINPTHRDYRRAGLWISKVESALLTDRKCLQWQTVQRGTIQHEIFEGDAAVAYVDGGVAEVKVNCRADAGRLDVPIPYALAVTLDVAEELRVPVYQEVSERIAVQADVRAAERV